MHSLEVKRQQPKSLDKETVQHKSQSVQFSQGPGHSIDSIQLKTNNTGLPDSLKSGVESLSGCAMDDVKVYYNSPKPAQLQAHAFAQGNQIHLGPGQERHLPHEAWHVAQQKQGRVQATTQKKTAVPINDDANLEREADLMGAKAAAYKLPVHQRACVNSVASKKGVAQCASTLSKMMPKENKLHHAPEAGNMVQHKQGRVGSPTQLKKGAGEEHASDEHEKDTDDKAGKLDHFEYDAKPFKIGKGMHRISFKKKGNKIKIGLHSNWVDLVKQSDKMVAMVQEAMKSEPPESDLGNLLKAVKNLQDFVTEKQEALDKLIVQKLHTDDRGDRLKLRHMIQEMENDAAIWLEESIANISAQHSDFIVKASSAHHDHFGKKFVDESVAEHFDKYHKGTLDDPIPIVWYKAPADYKQVHYYPTIQGKQGLTALWDPIRPVISDKKTASAFQSFTINNKDTGHNYEFGVADHNRPKIGQHLVKTRHDSDRATQKGLNNILTAAGFAIGDKSGLDGDHVTDLGFGGQDHISNYWPLEAGINRRAFHGYNSEYIVHYIDSQNKLAAKAVGGMVGKHFKIKGFMGAGGNVPAESHSVIAGMDAGVTPSTSDQSSGHQGMQAEETMDVQHPSSIQKMEPEVFITATNSK